MCIRDRSRPKPPVADTLRLVIHRDSKLDKDPLHESITGFQLQNFIFFGIICNFSHDMSFVVGIKIITVDDSYGVIQLEPVFEAQAAAGIEFQYPAFFHLRPDTRRDFDGFPRLQGEFQRAVKIISGRSPGRAGRHADLLVDLAHHFIRCSKE